MSQLQTTNQSAPVSPDQQYSPQQITLDDSLFNKCDRMAAVMASGNCTVPKHLQGNKGDCFAIIGQSLRWGMDPWAVAQKTHLVNGTLGYEAQLVIAVINSRAPIVDRISFEYFGDWSKVKGKADKSPDLGVICRATVKGDDVPTELSLSMAQVGSVRNSPLWEADPRQQLAYLAAKRFARLNFPDVILGVYTPDELSERNTQPKDITPRSKNAGASALLDRVKPSESVPVVEHFDISEFLATVADITMPNQVAPVEQQIQTLINDTSITIKDEDAQALTDALNSKKFDFMLEYIKACETLEDVEKTRPMIDKRKDIFSESDIQMLHSTLDVVAEDIAAEG